MPNQQPNLEQQFNQPFQPPVAPLKPKFNLKYILIVLILAAVVGGGILAYQYWWLPKHETKPPEITINNETANWQTYRNEGYGFKIKYPSAYSAKVDNDETGLLVVYFRDSQGVAYYGIHVTEDSKTPKLSNYVSNPECYEKIKTERQNNIDWVVNRWKCGIGTEQNPIAAYTVNESHVFEIQLDSNSESSSLAKISQILSAFKFIK